MSLNVIDRLSTFDYTSLNVVCKWRTKSGPITLDARYGALPNETFQAIFTSTKEQKHSLTDSIVKLIQDSSRIKSFFITFEFADAYCFRKIVEALGTHPKLEKIVAIQMPYKGDSAQGIKKMLETTSTLKTLNLNNLIRNKLLSEAVRPIAQGIGNNRTVTELALTINGQKGELGLILEALKTNRTLQKLTIDYSQILIPRQMNCSGIASNTTLRKLNLRHNKIQGEGAGNLFIAISMNSGLHTLNISDNPITVRAYMANDYAFRSLGELIARNKTIRTLDLSSTVIGSKIYHIANNLVRNETLTSLNLSQTELKTPELTIPVCKAIQKHPSLTHLDLSHCNLRSSAAMTLGENLKINNVLVSLKLENCDITNIEMEHISAGLQVNTTLKTLILNRNLIQSQGTRVLCESLYQNSSLQELSLNNNRLSDAALIEIMFLVRFNNSVQKLDISWNNFTYDHVENLSNEMRYSNYGLISVCTASLALPPNLIKIKNICERNIKNLTRHETLYQLLLNKLIL
jgi:Ran GTPase-activating protein (RanGAP) involved in mRNA processing and transport